MGMLPETMWWMRPQDFWRLYKHHLKKQLNEARKTAIYVGYGKLNGDEINDLAQDLFYYFSPTIKRKIEPETSIIEDMGQEDFDKWMKKIHDHIGEEYTPNQISLIK